MARLVEQYGRLRHQKRLRGRSTFHNDADDTARNKQPSLFGSWARTVTVSVSGWT